PRDGPFPANIPAGNHKQGRYSPLWDVHFAAWTETAMRQGKNTRQGVFFKLENLEDKGFVTGPDGAPFGANGIIVDCPLVTADGDDDVIQSVETTSWTAIKDMYRR